LVQILVVVANVQVRALRTDVEKGFALMAIGRKLVGPKESGKLRIKQEDPRIEIGFGFRLGQRTVLEGPPPPKGNRVNIPGPEIRFKLVNGNVMHTS